MKKIATVIIFLLLSSYVYSQNQINYFPHGTFSEKVSADRFTSSWYSKHLVALKEPSLFEKSQNSKGEAYRFLYLRTFHNPICLRLKINDDNSGTLYIKRTDGKGGYEPGKLSKETMKQVSKERVNELLLTILKKNFWKSSPYIKSKNVIHTDSAQWIFEGIKNGEYHVVSRVTPECEICSIGETFFRIANLKLKHIY